MVVVSNFFYKPSRFRTTEYIVKMPTFGEFKLNILALCEPVTMSEAHQKNSLRIISPDLAHLHRAS